MIELSQHIEVLLLENDCVIVPGFGGFVAHYAPAMRVEEENIFLPPTRTIGFNPQLKMNDGILVQSYMAVYDTNFSDATRMVEEEVEELIAILHEEGKTDLGNIGEIRYTIHNTYEFIPYDNKITTPYLYGLDSFEMKDLVALRQSVATDKALPVFTKEKKNYEIRINRAYLRNAVAMVAAIALFFFMSTPVENTDVANDNYAQLIPMEAFGRMGQESVVLKPVVTPTPKPNVVKSQPEKKAAPAKTAVKPVAVKEVKVGKVATEAEKPVVVRPQQTVEGAFHLIVASVGSLKDAETMAARLKEQGFAGAKALQGNGKIRVSIMSCATREEANARLSKLRENVAYQSAWILTK